MEACGLASSIIAVLQLTTKIIQYFNSVKNSSREQKQCATEATNLLVFLTRLKFRLEETNQTDPWYINVRALEAKGRELDQYKAATERLISYISKEGKLRKIGAALAWPFNVVEVADILASIGRLKSFISLSLELDHFKLSEAIKKETEIIPTVASDVKILKTSQEEQKMREIGNWLSPLDVSQQYNDFIAQRREGTGEWFLHSSQFLNWLEGSTTTLFCPGSPGTGKTIISSLVIQHLQDTTDPNTGGLAYLFCDYKSQHKQRTLDLLLVILKQLVMRLLDIPETLQALYEKHGNGASKLQNVQEVTKLIQEVGGRFDTVYLVIDALDEGSEITRDEFMSRLRQLQGPRIRVMMTSRPTGTIEEDVKTFDKSDILEIVADGRDIKRFVEGELPRLAACVSRDESLKSLVISAITEKSDRMFILARLHIELLVGEPTAKRIKAALRGLPRGSKQLSRTYEKTFLRLQSQPSGQVAIARTVLGWIINTKRPLTVNELQHALATEIGESYLDPDNIMDMSYILTACVGLVIVEGHSQEIRLVHYTAYEYLNEIWPSSISDSHKDIAESCITYLLFDTFDSDFRWSTDTFNGYYIFFDYAARNWGYHAHAASMQQHDLVLRFLSSQSKVSAATEVMFPSSTNSFRGNCITGMHVAAHFGLKESLTALVDAGYNLHEEDCHNRTPIFYAVANGQADTVQWLLHETCESSQPLKKRDLFGHTLLSWATIHGQCDVVKLLLGTNDVDVNSLSNDRLTPLSQASYGGHLPIAKLLLSTEDIRVDVGWPALPCAVKGGHVHIVRLLLEDGRVDVNAVGQSCTTPLAEAAYHGHNVIVALLLGRRGLVINARDDTGDSPLALAALANQYSTVKLLLDAAGVDPNSRDETGAAPLTYAAIQNLPEIVRLLLSDARVEADILDKEGRTPLSIAASGGCIEVVRVLLSESRVDPNSQDAIGRTPLSHAVSNSGTELVQLLLSDLRVKPDLANYDGKTPLSYAATRPCDRSFGIFQLLLLNPQVKPDSRDSANRSPLSYASSAMSSKIVQLCLSHPTIEPDPKDIEGRTPFSYAVTKKHPESVFERFCSNTQVDPNSQDIHGKTPLFYAVRDGHIPAVKLLLANDRVDPSLGNESGRSLLFHAASCPGERGEALLNLLRAHSRLDPDATR